MFPSYLGGFGASLGNKNSGDDERDDLVRRRCEDPQTPTNAHIVAQMPKGKCAKEKGSERDASEEQEDLSDANGRDREKDGVSGFYKSVLIRTARLTVRSKRLEVCICRGVQYTRTECLEH